MNDDRRTGAVFYRRRARWVRSRFSSRSSCAASAANSAVRVGLLGCGHRGSPMPPTFAYTDARIVALADLFQDQLDRAKQRFDKRRRRTDTPAWRRLSWGRDLPNSCSIRQDVDAVVIATPAIFHPGHLAGAVAGGKHIYLEKPVAMDAAGAKRVLEIARQRRGEG